MSNHVPFVMLRPFMGRVRMPSPRLWLYSNSPFTNCQKKRRIKDLDKRIMKTKVVKYLNLSDKVKLKNWLFMEWMIPMWLCDISSKPSPKKAKERLITIKMHDGNLIGLQMILKRVRISSSYRSTYKTSTSPVHPQYKLSGILRKFHSLIDYWLTSKLVNSVSVPAVPWYKIIPFRCPVLNDTLKLVVYLSNQVRGLLNVYWK